MKKISTFLVISLLIFNIFLNSCQNTNKQSDKDEGYVLQSLQKLFNADRSLPFAQQEIDTADAKACIRLYEQTMPSGIRWGTGTIPALTKRVKFRGGGLGDWIQDLRSNSNYGSIRICFGIYTKEYIDKYVSDVSERTKLYGRLTAFLWPYDNNDRELLKPDNVTPQKPYNLGGLEP